MERDQFTDQEFEQVMEWTLLTQAIIGQGPEFYRETLKDAVDEVAAKCNASWPLQAGEENGFTIAAAEIEANLSLLGEDVTLAWLGKTALCLFAGIDGPLLTADVLKDGIDKLTDDIEARQA